MAKVFEGIDGTLRTWLERQVVFFVATAPLSPDGHVNLSPKGLRGTFRVLDEHTVAYLDLTGSGAETIAHLRENGRIVLMFCAFDGPPRIVRLWGRGEAVLPSSAAFAGLADVFPAHPGTRSVIRVDVARIADSCGFGVPLMSVDGERDILDRSHVKRGPAKLADYRDQRNATSLDGLPAWPAGEPVVR